MSMTRFEGVIQKLEPVLKERGGGLFIAAWTT